MLATTTHTVQNPLLEFFDCVSPEDVIWSAGRLLFPVYGNQKLVFWLVTETTGELRVFRSEGISDLEVGGTNQDLRWLSAWSVAGSAILCQIDPQTGHFSYATMLKNRTGPRFIVEIRDVAPDSLLARHHSFVLAVITKAYHAAADKVERENSTQQLRRAHDLLGQKLELRELELATAAAQASRAQVSLQQKQEQLIQVQKLAALGQLTAGVAHEINNPLSYANTNLIVAQRYWKKLKSTVPAEANHSLESLGASLEDSLEGMKRVLAIVRDLKELAHRRNDEVQEVSIHDVIDRTVAIAMSPYKHRIKVTKSYHGDVRWACDPQIISQVVLNLVVNAAQAIGGTGEIKVATKIADDKLQIEISDSGCGIQPDKLSAIFEPFYTSKPIGEGTGLGLSTCLELVQAANGEIRCDSVPNIGTTFTVVLTDKRKSAHTASRLAASKALLTPSATEQTTKPGRREPALPRPLISGRTHYGVNA